MDRNRIFSIEKPILIEALFITIVITILGAFGEGATKLLRYERDLLPFVQCWRLFSGHLVHLGWAHFSVHMAGFWMIILLYGSGLRPLHLMSTVILIALGTSFGLLIFSPEIVWYVGLSGVLHGLIIMGALKNFSNEPWSSSIIFLGVSIKLLWEQLYADGSDMKHIIGGNVIYDAHLYGAITGIILICIIYMLGTRLKQHLYKL